MGVNLRKVMLDTFLEQIMTKDEKESNTAGGV